MRRSISSTFLALVIAMQPLAAAAAPGSADHESNRRQEAELPEVIWPYSETSNRKKPVKKSALRTQCLGKKYSELWSIALSKAEKLERVAITADKVREEREIGKGARRFKLIDWFLIWRIQRLRALRHELIGEASARYGNDLSNTKTLQFLFFLAYRAELVAQLNQFVEEKLQETYHVRGKKCGVFFCKAIAAEKLPKFNRALFQVAEHFDVGQLKRSSAKVLEAFAEHSKKYSYHEFSEDIEASIGASPGYKRCQESDPYCVGLPDIDVLNFVADYLSKSDVDENIRIVFAYLYVKALGQINQENIKKRFHSVFETLHQEDSNWLVKFQSAVDTFDFVSIYRNRHKDWEDDKHSLTAGLAGVIDKSFQLPSSEMVEKTIADQDAYGERRYVVYRAPKNVETSQREKKMAEAYNKIRPWQFIGTSKEETDEDRNYFFVHLLPEMITLLLDCTEAEAGEQPSAAVDLEEAACSKQAAV